MSRQTSSKIFWEINESLDTKNINGLSTVEVLIMTQESIAREIWNARWQGIESISFEGNVYLLDKQGGMIYNNYDLDSDTRLDEDKNTEVSDFFKDDYSDAPFFQKIKADKSKHKGTGGNGLVRISTSGYVNYNRKGKEYIGAYSKIASLGWILIVDGQKEDILAPAKKIRRKMYYITALAIFIVTIIAVLISKYMTNPINQTVEFAKKIANGDLAIKGLTVNSNDEIGTLVEHLNNMRSNLERSVNNMKNLLNNAGQGFLSFGEDLKVDKEYSVECRNIFATDIENKSFPRLIFNQSKQQERIRENLKEIFSLINANQEEEIHKYIGLLPEELKINDKYIKLNYKVVSSN
ncbi:methyl-accepting chemotaxis protein [Halanaerobacter jeridensis]|uniref:histidine kinase n=2 Tax=Halanaerobacter jeridensis TaxID=706427 RepID=A0A939BR10_9FIRM|nr:methyl-accepting chemotaxis protein [Halanaerobacter jeridensis]